MEKQDEGHRQVEVGIGYHDRLVRTLRLRLAYGRQCHADTEMTAAETVHDALPVLVTIQLRLFRKVAEPGIHAVALLLGVAYEGRILIQEVSHLEHAQAQIMVVVVRRRTIVFVGQVFPFHRFVDGVGQEAAEKTVVGRRDETGELSESTREQDTHQRTRTMFVAGCVAFELIFIRFDPCQYILSNLLLVFCRVLYVLIGFEG